MRIGILIFPVAEELDFVGPWEVFTMSAMARNNGELPEGDVVLIAETKEPVKAAKGMVFTPDYSIDDAPEIDILLVPGGQGTRTEINNKKLMDWVAKVSKTCTWVTSVCTGSYVLAEAGPAAGKRVTTHWAFIEGLREHGKAGEVLENVRYVRDGNVLTSAGVSAGIDMSLWLIGEIWGQEHARTVQHFMEYNPQPPYAGLT